MNASINHRCGALHQISQIDEFSNCVRDIVNDLGFDDFVYLNWVNTSPRCNSGEALVLSSYPADFVAQYRASQCYRLDPVIKYIREEKLPTTWGPHHFKDSAAEPMYWKANSLGACSGAAFPVPSPIEMVSVFGYSSRKTYEEARSDLMTSMPYGQLLALHVHQSVMRLYNLREKTRSLHITQRETRCLLLAAQGLRDMDIAAELGITPRTVIFHLSNARQKLGADTRAQTIARAISLNVIRL